MSALGTTRTRRKISRKHPNSHSRPSTEQQLEVHQVDSKAGSCSSCVELRFPRLSLSAEQDKTLDLDENSSIVSISLGRPGRPYVLRDDIFNPTTEMEVGV